MGSIIVAGKRHEGAQAQLDTRSPPNLKKVLPGCRFADRCPYVEERCRADGVQERTVGGRTYRCWRDEQSLREIYSHE